MPLSLTAEQKNINHIFNSSDVFIVPAYQRPYSWEYEQCIQLYNDITEAYNNRTDYFLGNIIIAKAEDAAGKLYTVDGQQRIITLWLLLRVLYLLFPTSRILRQKTEIESREDGEPSIPSVASQVFEKGDNISITSIYGIKDLSTLEGLYVRNKSVKFNRIIESRCDRMTANFLWFYSWLSDFKRRDELDCRSLIDFILDHVYLLPIELSEKLIEDATNKALSVFETINNRGMNLEDADIFKAKLYNKADSEGKGHLFLERWSKFRINAEELGLSVDSVFRYYSHIIRGKQGITTSLINLRLFFIESSFSPLVTNSFENVMSDLEKVLSMIAQIKHWASADCETGREEEVAKWIQVLDCYTNQYPSFSIVTYLYLRGYSDINHNEFLCFLKGLVRYSYLMGSSTSVKFEIFNIIKRIAQGDTVLIPEETFKQFHKPLDYSMRLRKGYALLAYYLKGGSLLRYYSLDKILTLNTLRSPFLFNDFGGNQEQLIQSIGNDIIIKNSKRYLSERDRVSLFESSDDSEYIEIANAYSTIEMASLIQKRTEQLNIVFNHFFFTDGDN